MKQTHKLVLLPTDKASSSFYLHTEKLYNHKTTMHIPDGNQILQHLYLLSDEKIKEGDWCYIETYLDGGIYKVKVDNEVVMWGGSCMNKKTFTGKKIIATTDKLLIKIGESSNKKYWLPGFLPQFPDSFISEYVKAYNSSKPITEITVEYEWIREHGMWKKEEYGSKLKLNSDNTIIISPSGVYTELDMRKAYFNYEADDMSEEGFQRMLRTL